ncbi:MAG: PEP/pyruvate-binding domain-containing protein [Gemmatimonadaceae bacterium]
MNTSGDGTPRGLALDGATLGGKAANLLRVEAVGLPHQVPRWFAIPAEVHQRLVLHGPTLTDADDAERRRQRVLAMDVPDEVRAAVQQELTRVRLHGVALAVRSSATIEDGAAASYAGQFETVLGVVASSTDDSALWDAVRRVWSSAFGRHALAYSGGSAIGAPAPMAVVIQELVDARAAGVAFSVDPLSGDGDTAVVSAVLGLGESLVSGAQDADTWRVVGRGPSASITATIAEKTHALVRTAAGGTTRVEVAAAERSGPSLSDSEVRAVADAARALATALGAPQDVEWAFSRADGRLLIVQTRPVTATGTPVPTGEVRVWDNSNIIESYGGLTSPLTFSFARSVYEDVYIQFCRLVGVSESLIGEYRHVFAHMLGLIRGRVYYNLLNWYRVLAMLPGYAFNREFMERMMGVREKLAEPPDPPPAANRWVDLSRLLRTVARLVIANRALATEVPAFHSRVSAALDPLAGEDLSARSPEELLRLYRRLEDSLLRHWQPPLVNDFFAMIWFGVLGRLVERWLPAEPPTLVNDLLCGEGGIVSTEPARRVMALARIVHDDPVLTAMFAAEPDDTALAARIKTDGAARGLRQALDDYLRRFGDRCMSELKLETVTPSEDPAWVVMMIRAYVVGGATAPEAGQERERAIRASAERRADAGLAGFREWAFHRVLASARVRIRDRENLRFERTRVFGVVRRIFVAFGRHLATAGRLDDARDVFWLTRDEVFSEVEGTATTQDLRALVALRRSEYARYASEPAPPDRFTTRGMPGDAVPAATSAAAASGADLRGIGCCPGIVRAPVRVVIDPSQAGDLRGRILVAERTDPGWTLLFPTSSGLLVQRGSLLSHSAIVAREMGIPCIVAIPGLLDTLVDGEIVEMDGTTGVVRRIDSAATA